MITAMTMERPDVDELAAKLMRTVDFDSAIDDPSVRVRAWELSGPEHDAWEAGFLLGVTTAHPDVLAEIHRLRQLLAQAEHDADRYYAEMCQRPARAPIGMLSYAELCHRRGESDRAERHIVAMATLFEHTPTGADEQASRG